MDKGTFGSEDKYKMLEFLTEKISLMGDKKKKYISSLIHDINKIILKCRKINDISFRNYVLDLVHNNLNERIVTVGYMKSSLTTADATTHRPYIGYFLYSVLATGGFTELD